MSEKSKGDTSSSVAAPPTSARIVKNPLLSASVTGLTFDDFQNKPLLLPAAPPIIHAVPVVSCSRESTPLVTVGKSSDIDTENLSEINLNDISGSTTSNAPDISDENSNSLLEPSVQAENSILSQAATSFSQLPSVASSVFSTFSKKFNSSTTREDINSNPKLDIQPFGTQATNIQPPPAAFANSDQQQINISQNEPQLPIEPPTFYSPTEVPSVPAGFPHPPISSGQNTYRISARKKIYAPIPGLSAAHQEQNFPPANTSYLPPIGFETAPVPVYGEQPPSKPEDSKGGLFSLSNLVPGVPSVFQNLSGFVQSAAGSLSQKLQEQPSQQQIDNNFVQPSSAYYSPPNQNFVGVDPSLQQAYPPPTPAPINYYNPPGAGAVQSIPQPAAQDQQSVGNFFASLPPKSESVNPDPEVIPPTLLPQRPASVGVLYSEQPLQNSNFTTPAPAGPPIIPSGNPIPQPSSGGPLFPKQLHSETLTNIPPVATGPPFLSSPQPLPSGINFAAQPSQSASASVEILQRPPPTGSLFVGYPPQSNTPTNIPPVGSGPPTAGVADVFGNQQLPSKAPPPIKPPGGPPSSSFRLQKGTRLYKSPFAAATTAEYPSQQISGYPPALHSFVPPSQTTTQVFNPFYPPHQGSAPIQGTASATVLAPKSATDIIQETNIFRPLYQNSFEQESVLATKQTEAVNSEQQIPLQAPPPSILFESQSVNIKAPSLTGEKVSLSPLQPFVPSQESPSALLSEKENLSAKAQQPGFYSPFNPLQLTPAETVVPTKETPLVSESNPENSSVQEEARPLTTFQILQPVESTLTSESSKQPALVPIKIIPEQEQQQHTLFSSAPLSKELRSTFNPVNTPETESRKESDNPGTIEQFNISQSVNLPPPPVATSGISASSKETANFPPPPPHAFQNQANSNPYRRGLPSHHTQAPPSAALSSFFTPIGQDVNLFNQIATEPVPLPSATPCVAEFFSPAAAPEPSKLPEGITSTDSPIESNSTLQTDIQTPPGVSAIFTPIPASAPTLPLAESLSFETASIQSAPVSSSGIPVETSQLKEDSELTAATVTPATNPISFFKPDPPSDSFSAVLTHELPIFQESSKPITAAAPPPAPSSKIASPLESKEKLESQQSVPNLFTNFFEHAAPTAGVTPTLNQPLLPDPTSFFDSFGQVPSVGVDVAPPPEDPNSQRIQNFFNNPPPKDLDPVGDLNYNLVGSGLSVKNLQTRSLTPASNLAEPPSSSCSEFSELNNSLSAANRQPRIPADDSNKVSPEEGVIFEAPDNQDLPEEIINEIKMANSALDKNGAAIPANVVYKPAVKHWFYKRKLDTKHVWTPFSHYDSALLESAFILGDGAPNLIAVEGGRYDVNIMERTKAPVYWEGEPIEVKRCSWFYKANDSKYVPYEEQVADLLEEEYKKASDKCEWHKKIPISAGDMVVFHGPTVIVHFHQQQLVDSWGGSTQTSTRPRVVKRDLDDFVIEEGETHKVDHLLYMVHGIGSACDLKMRSVEEVVDEFRGIALQLVQSHYKNSVENGFVGRVEVLPVSWHGELHSDELGIDEKLKSITLESIPKLRNFTNDTLLDILFYTSPMFCQRIMNTVTASMNSIFMKYKQRNPDFRGGVSLAGHSLGSLILFDLLCHQRPLKECDEGNMENPDEINPGDPVDSNKLNEDTGSNISYQMGPAGTGQPFISYPQLLFQPKKFFAFGSPIGMFVTIRGIDKLGLDFRLPTCAGFYNIFHPYDPVAYRLEALVNPDMTGIPPVLIPHHKGRKRMHLELKETMSRVGADLKQRFFETFKTTFDSVGFLAPKALKNDSKEMEKEVEKAHQDQQARQGPSTSRSRANSNSTNQSDTEMIEVDFPLGKLNDSKRVDYVLQEAPLEFFNEYLFALSSHVCYWESEDTILFVMKEIYTGLGISTDSQVPQQTMTIERPSSSGSTTQSPTS